MTDADKFLAAIITNPDDDLPRLVFADWLEEHGDADRAEFIRLQCSLERDTLIAGERRRIEERVTDLLKSHERRWKMPGIPCVQRFRRGFVEEVRISAEDLLKHAEILGQSAPITDLWLTAAERYTSAITTVPWLSRLRSLHFRTDSIGLHFRDLFRPNLFAELRSLTIANARLWSEHVATLTTLHASWPRLERLDLSGNPLGDEGITHIASATGLRGLRELILRSDGLDSEYRIHEAGATALANSQTLTRLRELNLAGHDIGNSGFTAIVRSPNIAGLELFDVSRNGIGEFLWDSLEALVDSPHVGRIRQFNFAGNTIHPSGYPLLLKWPNLRAGCVIDLRGCVMPSNAMRAFRESEFRNQLRLDEAEE